ncbi:MAG: SpoIID/LytB domain-containing protein [bacterium]
MQIETGFKNLKFKIYNLKFTILFLLLSLSVFPFDIRVCVAKEKNLVVSSSGYYEISSPNGKIIRRYETPLSLEAIGGLIKIEGYEPFYPPIIIEPINSHIIIGKRRYRGNIEINVANGILLAINTIDIEQYLYGLIKMEINPDWPYETLKAQAIIARTFVYRNLGKHRKEGFDLCNSVHCQVYAGMNAEDERAIKAVDETKGELLYYGDELAFCYYHSVCGGKTGDSAYTWEGGKKIPYLSGVICPYCTKAPHYHWRANIKLVDIEKRLNIGKIYSISKYPKNGRLEKVIIKHSKGEYKMVGSQFRRLFGENFIRSTFFDIEQRKDSILLTGRGYGHGVGLCQWGAKRMGELGFSKSEILSFYFPGCEIKTIEEKDDL